MFNGKYIFNGKFSIKSSTYWVCNFRCNANKFYSALLLHGLTGQFWYSVVWYFVKFATVMATLYISQLTHLLTLALLSWFALRQQAHTVTICAILSLWWKLPQRTFVVSTSIILLPCLSCCYVAMYIFYLQKLWLWTGRIITQFQLNISCPRILDRPVRV